MADGKINTPGCTCPNECEFPCWQRIGLDDGRCPCGCDWLRSASPAVTKDGGGSSGPEVDEGGDVYALVKGDCEPVKYVRAARDEVTVSLSRADAEKWLESEPGSIHEGPMIVAVRAALSEGEESK